MKQQYTQQLLKITDTLQEACQDCSRLYEQGNYDNVITLLADSQEAAASMCEMIEQLQGKGIKTVELLEEFYKLLYQINACISDAEQGKPDFYAAKQSLQEIKSSIQSELKPERIEILFLPYKASMWDSLESIWIAAKDDPKCDAVVVPIPYYEKMPDGSLGQMHYEGGDYPSYVPIVDWQEYDLAARCPEVAFIHNPYDNTNNVTQVHPMFFTENLKKYAGLLCYSPYFVVQQKLYPPFAYMPAVLNADVVFVQSEKVRQQYLQVWEDIVEESHGNKAVIEMMQKKILPLGSPKFDAMVNPYKADSDIPEDWRQLMTDSMGMRKKVVFYNTSLSTMLADTLAADNRIDDRYLKKLKKVLDFFRQRKDTVLLWRPHPLMAQTFESTRPSLYPEYLELVTRYKQEGYGIYDDSPDLHRAIAASDLYYGDSSSVVPLFQAAGKIALIQNSKVLDFEKRFVISEMYYDGEYLWGLALDFNGLFRIDAKTHEITFMGQSPGEKKEGYHLFYGIAEHSGKLYFCPYNAKAIGVYEKADAKFTTLSLKEEIRNKEKKFTGIFADNQYIYLQGSRAHTIVRIDAETDEMIYIENWVKKFAGSAAAKSEYYIQRGCAHNGILYYASSVEHGLLCINPKDFSNRIIPVQHSCFDGLAQLLSDGKVIWLLQAMYEKGAIAYFNPETLKVTELKSINFPDSFCKVGAYIYYFSFTELQFYRVHIESKEIQTFPLQESIYSACAAGNQIFMMTYMTGNLYVFDTVQLQTQKADLRLEPLQLPELDNWEMIKSNENFYAAARESGFLNLESLLKASAAADNSQPAFGQESSGSKIYEYVKGLAL